MQFKKAVLRLDVTPQITPDNRIIMNVEIRKDSVGQMVNLGGGFQVPSIDTRNVTTQISVNNGDTAVIGGIYEEAITNTVDKVPFLGDIPFLGYLFKQTGRTSEKQELLIFLTPRVDQGIDQHDQVTDPSGDRARRARGSPSRRANARIAGCVHAARSSGHRESTTMRGCICIGAICFWSDCRARANRRSDASSRGASPRRSSTPMPSSNASSE